MFSFQGTYKFHKKLNEISPYVKLQSVPQEEVVGQSGLEPPTSRLSVVCSSQLSYWPVRLLFGGEYRDRTGDLLLARQALSQLS